MAEGRALETLFGDGVCGTETRDGEIQLQPVNGNQGRACNGDPQWSYSFCRPASSRPELNRVNQQ